LSSKDPLTYREAGVERDRADTLIDRIGKLAKSTHGPGVHAGVGGFASLFSLKESLEIMGGAWASMKDPLLVSGTDGVGTKLAVAFMMDQHDTVGIDLVAMCVNDVITTGARPLFFLDYIATAKLDVDRMESIVKGVARGCTLARCALVGGETAQMPGIYREGEYDLAGFAVGVVDRESVIDGRAVRAKDAIIAVRSRGLHSNGFSLVRKALFERAGYSVSTHLPELGNRRLGEVLLEPTAIYADTVAGLTSQVETKAIAHITGSGIPGNLPRVLPNGVVARIDRSTWQAHPIFDLVQRAGGVSDEEMFATFNMGVGLVVVVDPSSVVAALAAIRDAGEEGVVIGEIRAGLGPDVEAFVELR
jgi:phosphoribosylformylglycinamidine cyclo-ligase